MKHNLDDGMGRPLAVLILALLLVLMLLSFNFGRAAGQGVALPCLPYSTYTHLDRTPLTDSEVSALFALPGVGEVRADYTLDAWTDAAGVDLRVRWFGGYRVEDSAGRLMALVAVGRTNRAGLYVYAVALRDRDWHCGCAALVAGARRDTD